MAEGHEVQGRKTLFVVNVGSTRARYRYCNACPSVKAISFCVNCHEYMCTDCTSYHRKITATRGHILLTGDEFPSREPPKPQDASITLCPVHKKEEIKLYCEKHDTLCCVVCNALKHEHCTKMYIHDIAEDYRNRSEFGKLYTDIRESDQLIVDSLAEIEKCLKAVGTLKAREIDKLKKYRAKIIEYLDRREKELQAEIQHMHDEDVALLNELKTQLMTSQSELQEMRAKLKSHEKDSSELFIAAKRICSQLDQLQSSLQETRGKIGYRHYSLQLDTNLKNILQDEAGFAFFEMINGKVLVVVIIIMKDNKQRFRE